MYPPLSRPRRVDSVVQRKRRRSEFRGRLFWTRLRRETPAILLDVEGTTTPIAFVYDVLFPFARRRIASRLPYLDLTGLKREHDEDVRQARNPPAWSDDPIDYIAWLMDQDRKSTALKQIQGEVW